MRALYILLASIAALILDEHQQAHASSGDDANKLAYIVATYGGTRHSDASRDLVAPNDYLRVHLEHLASVPTRHPMTVIVVRPPLQTGHMPQPSYYDVALQAAALESAGRKVRWVTPMSNEGSYAQLFSAHEAIRSDSARNGSYFGGPFRWFLWTEDDYTAHRPFWDAHLVALHRHRSFHHPGRHLVLAGLLQGYPHEAASALPEHCQTGLWGAIRTLDHLAAQKPRHAAGFPGFAGGGGFGGASGGTERVGPGARADLLTAAAEVLWRHPDTLNRWNALQVAFGVFLNRR